MGRLVRNMSLTNEEIRHIARLARLALSDAEVAGFGTDLSIILDHFRALQELDTGDVPAAAHASLLQNVARDDTPRPSLPVEDAIANAPRRQDLCLRVPPILE
ncbi:MAG: Asp-tRNA(Asn)/Glu-tRNA(Gln) amidotransferase subunit GatC [Dehalococcoidia bacterium]|nr:Asp-tRNA(Asn)/Glu-tRNA(Gln) amidotransferase subunit GatC [Dehalococcoidia bacterium]